MNALERRAQLTAAPGRIVRTSVSASKYIAVMECTNASRLKRLKDQLQAQGWSIGRTSGFSVMVEVRL